MLRKVLLVFLLTAAMVLVYQSNQYLYKDIPRASWRHYLFADPAGYFGYLPVIFIYDLDPDALPADLKEYNGLKINVEKIPGKIHIQYTCGIAMLQSPLFFAVWAFASDNTYPEGFAGAYDKVPVATAAFWFVMGLYWLFLFLRKNHGARSSLLAIIAIVFGTNVFYYAVYEPGYSHIYNFGLIAGFLLLTQRLIAAPGRWGIFCLWCLTLSFIVLIRPVNIIVLVAVFMDMNNFRQTKDRLLIFVKGWRIPVGIAIAFLVALPQLIYWHYLTGNFIYYSYDNERFTHLLDPDLLKTLFAPGNGLFPYSPILLPVVLGLLVMVFKRERNSRMVLFIFLAAIYLTAAWYNPRFGCGLGMRNMVDLTPFMALPAARLFEIAMLKNGGRILAALFLLSSIYLAQTLTGSFNNCFFGKGDWDWAEYGRLITKP